MEFPKDFLWGAATSAYQVEGNNVNSDWWEWEHKAGLVETSGNACRHYELYKEDFELAGLLHHNCHRLSIEWSRVEPNEGEFSEKEISHYADAILYLRQLNIEPVVTLHHFTNPLWFKRSGGWQNRKACAWFLRYVECVVEALSSKVHYWVTINEPMVYVYHGYISGIWPPQVKSILKAESVMRNMGFSHLKAYKAIRDIYRRKNLPMPLVSIAANLQAFTPCSMTLRNKFSAYLRDKLFNFEFINRIFRHRCLDFIGINYYTRNLIDVQGWAFKNLVFDVCGKNHDPLKKNSLGWDIYPQGLYNLLLELRKYGLPVFILENGVSTDDDNTRWEFIAEHLKNIHLAMAQGVKVLGYIYWSLIDNFEWDKGFGHRFGLIGVDYNTYKRTIRESAKKFASVCKTGRLD